MSLVGVQVRVSLPVAPSIPIHGGWAEHKGQRRRLLEAIIEAKEAIIPPVVPQRDVGQEGMLSEATPMGVLSPESNGIVKSPERTIDPSVMHVGLFAPALEGIFEEEILIADLGMYGEWSTLFAIVILQDPAQGACAIGLLEMGGSGGEVGAVAIVGIRRVGVSYLCSDSVYLV